MSLTVYLTVSCTSKTLARSNRSLLEHPCIIIWPPWSAVTRKAPLLEGDSPVEEGGLEKNEKDTENRPEEQKQSECSLAAVFLGFSSGRAGWGVTRLFFT